MNIFDDIAAHNDNALDNYLKTEYVNLVDDDGESLLHYAIKFKNDYAFDLLLKSYINLNIKDNYGNTPLIFSILHNEIGYFKRLIKEKADLNLVNSKHESPIMIALNQNKLEMAKILFQENVDLDIKNINDENLYFSLVKSHNLELLKEMLNNNKDYINSYNYTHMTLLHQAVKISDYDITDFLLKNGLLPNLEDNFQETPIFIAVRNKDLKIISLLIENGALLGKRNNFFENVYDIASKDVLEFLNYKENSSKYNRYIKKYPLHCAVVYNDYIRTKQLINKYNLNKKDDYGYLAIEYAEKLNHREILKLLKLNYNKHKK